MRLVFKYIIALTAVFCSERLAAQVTCNLSVTATPVGTSCSNLCNGSVTLTPTGGTAPYSTNAFDHSFPGTGVDLSVFDIRNGNYLVLNNVLTALPNANISTGFNNAISTRQVFAAANKIVAEASFYVDNSAYGYWGLAENATITNEYQFPISFYFSNGALYTYNNGMSAKVGSYSANTWYDLKIEKVQDTVSYYIRSTGLSTYTLISSSITNVTETAFKLAATYRNSFSTFGGFKSMNWKIGGNPPTTNLCPGTYTYTVYDAVGCYASTTVTIGSGTGPSSLQLNGSVTPASCNVASDGAISLTPSGGIAPYSYGLSQNLQGNRINTSIFELRNGNFSQNTDLREGVNVNSNTGWDNSIATRQTFSDGGYLKFEGSFSFDAATDAAFGFTANTTVNDLSNILAGFRVAGGNTLFILANTQGLQQAGSIVSNTWYDFKIEKIGTALKFYTRQTGNSTYNLVYSTIYPSNIIEYRLAAVNYSNYFSGTGGYNTKNWSVAVTPKVTQLSSGTYTYTITDAAGCTATTVFSIGQSTNAVSVNATLINGSFTNGATGAVSLNPVGGVAPLKYQFEESFGDTLLNIGWFTARNGSFAETNDLRSNSITGNQTWNNSVSTNLIFSDAGFLSCTGSFKFDAGTMAGFGFTTNSSTINDLSQLVMGFTINGTQLSGRAGRSNNQDMATISPDTWYDLKVEKINGLVRFYLRNSGVGSYNLIYTIPYSDSLNIFKAGLVVFGNNAGLNTKNWIVNSNPSLTGLAAGTYAYTVYDLNGCYAIASINVPSIARSVISSQSVNSSAWNVCNGSVSFTNVPLNSSVYNILYQQAFAGTQLPGGELTVRNGSYSMNGGLVSSQNSTTPSNWDNSVVTKDSYVDNGYVSAEMDMRFSSGSNVYFGLANGNGSLNNYTGMSYAFYYSSGKLYAYTADAGQTLIGSVSANTFYAFKVEKTATSVKFYIRTSLDNDFQLVYTTTTSNTSGASYRAGFINNNLSQAFSTKNWIVVNNAASNGLCLGNYNYRIATPGLSPVSVSFTVNTNVSIVHTMTGPSDVTVNTNAGVAFATGVSLGNPSFSGNSSGVTVSHNAPVQFPLGTTTVTWTATDEWNNTASGTQKVTVVDKEAPSITAPANIAITVMSGQATVTGINLGSAMVSDNVGVVSVTNNTPSSFGIGTTNVTWTAKDAAGNTSTAIQKIIITASLIPVITAPADITSGTDAGKAYASNIALGSPSSTGSLLGLLITNNAPAQFPLGSTTVTWKVADILGNYVTATQKVTIIDMEAPSASIANVTVSTNAGVSYATGVNLGIPVTHDNVGVVSATNNAPSQFPLGTTIITWTVKDAAGNTNSATQKVIVADTEKPTVTAPQNITVSTIAGMSYATGVDLGKPIATDNVGVDLITNNAPLQFPLGSTIVTWTVTDAAGNFSTANQTITVVNGCQPYATTVTSIPTNSTFTGGSPNNLYLGYGAQSTKLQVTVPNTGGPYTFQWIGTGLSSTSSSAPIFTPAAAGVYTFYVNVKNNNGCSGSASITICVKDARVLNSKGTWDGKKVYVCHLPPGNPSNAQLLSVSVNAVDAHVGNHGGDGLASCTQTCSSPVARNANPAVDVFGVKAYPNPSADFFSLIVKSEDKYTRITVRIVDAFGRTVQTFDNITADKAIQFGDKYASGAYYAEVAQGEERKVIPLMKAK